MPVSNPNKTVSDAVMACGGLTTVTLSFDAEPELNTNPADIVLIMDTSRSMTPNDMNDARSGAKALIRTVAKASGSADASAILNGSRIGMVGFSTTAEVKHELSTDVSSLETAVQALTIGDRTNHEDAFDKAFTMLQSSTAPRRIMIMFTDGVSSEGGDPVLTTEAIKSVGIEIYCIGMDQATPETLNVWSSTPNSKYVVRVSDRKGLQRAFDEVAAEVVEAGSLDMVIHEVVTAEFEIADVHTPTHGTATLLGPRTLEWKADAVGAAGKETASLSFVVKHVGVTSGARPVNQSITYADRQGSVLTFPDPKVTVNCEEGGLVIVEPCPAATNFQLKGCQDAAIVVADDTVINGLGRIVQVDALVKNVCPGKRVAVALLLSEVDDQGKKYPRGLKTVLIPPQQGKICRDVQLKCVSFVVPEVLDVSGNTTVLCNPRKFAVQVLANYVDTDFVCCDAKTEMA